MKCLKNKVIGKQIVVQLLGGGKMETPKNKITELSKKFQNTFKSQLNKVAKETGEDVSEYENLSPKEHLTRTESILENALTSISPELKGKVDMEEISKKVLEKFKSEEAYMTQYIDDPEKVSNEVMMIIENQISDAMMNNFSDIFDNMAKELDTNKKLDAVYCEWMDGPQRYGIKIMKTAIVFERFEPKHQSQDLFIFDIKTKNIQNRNGQTLDDREKKKLATLYESMAKHNEKIDYYMDVEK